MGGSRAASPKEYGIGPMGSNQPKPTSLPGASSPSRAGRQEFLQALSESLRSKTGGEVVIRAGDRIGRVYVFRGRIAWVTASSLPRTLTDHLVSKGVASAADISAAFAECRRLGANFAEMLVSWGLIDRDRMRTEMLEHISRALVHILDWGSVVTLFVPSSREYKGSLIYSVAELVDSVRAIAPGRAEVLRPLLEEPDGEAAPAQAKAAGPPPLGEPLRSAILQQLDQLRGGAGIRGICFAGDGTSCGDVLEVVSNLGAASFSATAEVLRAASEACVNAGYGASAELMLVGSNGALLAWQVAGGEINGLVMVLVDREAQLPLTRILVERTLDSGPLKRVKVQTEP